eukprot:TRINITY_DN4841_c0_g1_i1.p2 TRINITY_DN4841_c0_g1~~TRINITY_DN4841_c0_g1_i1.p2  ORF type:complete len:119 (+),score=40.42 TRINITY_DN4841_c0_g1_i1:829-1185(+)
MSAWRNSAQLQRSAQQREAQQRAAMVKARQRSASEGLSAAALSHGKSQQRSATARLSSAALSYSSTLSSMLSRAARAEAALTASVGTRVRGQQRSSDEVRLRPRAPPLCAPQLQARPH